MVVHMRRKKQLVFAVALGIVLCFAACTAGKNTNINSQANNAAESDLNNANANSQEGGVGETASNSEDGSEGEAASNGENVNANETTQIPEDNTVVTGPIEPNYDGIKTKANNAKVSVHDPSIAVFDGKYYIYGSHMTCAVSDDMQTWTWVAQNYSAGNKVYSEIYKNKDAYAYSGLGTSLIKTDDGANHVWAPHVIYNEKMGKYCMYFCMSSTWNASNLALATADSPEGPFIWQCALIYSGFNKDTVYSTDVLDYVDRDFAARNYYTGTSYNYQKFPNAIDPSVFYDEDGRMWMVYGSWSGGIFLLEIDEETGKVIHPEADPENNVDVYFGKKLIGGGHKSIEGPYIQYDSTTGYYYLYVSYGGLNQTGGYQIRVFRSDKADGTYVDLNGNTSINQSAHNNFGVKLSGNYYLPSIKNAYMATGGQSAFQDTDGKTYICYHSRFDKTGEMHEPVVKQVFYNEEGWPCLLPYKTAGETISKTGYSTAEIAGEYYFINQGSKIDKNIAQPVIITLREDGTICGSYEGTWKATDGTYYIHISIDGTDFSGVLCKQFDMTGVEVMTFTAVGGLESIWGVKY